MPNIRDWKNRESKMRCLVKKIGLIDFRESLTSRVKCRCRRCEHEPSTAEPRAKRLDSARIGAKIAATRLDKRRRPPCGENRSENHPSDPRARVTQIPSRILGYTLIPKAGGPANRVHFTNKLIGCIAPSRQLCAKNGGRRRSPANPHTPDDAIICSVDAAIQLT
jgi:hypothetical protein